jgi:hypothetical protein
MQKLMSAARARLTVMACALALAVLAGCATHTPPVAPIARLTPEQLAAIPSPGPTQAEEATRLTQQADREAQAALAARQRHELELQRWLEHERRFNWSLGYWPGYPHPYGWGGAYRFP